MLPEYDIFNYRLQHEGQAATALLTSMNKLEVTARSVLQEFRTWHKVVQHHLTFQPCWFRFGPISSTQILNAWAHLSGCISPLAWCYLLNCSTQENNFILLVLPIIHEHISALLVLMSLRSKPNVVKLNFSVISCLACLHSSKICGS